MPPARRKPHPRSLEALFPPPRKAVVKRCSAGHSQSAAWRPSWGCTTCTRAESDRRADEDSRTARERFSASNRTTPVMTMLETSTGRVIRHEIPVHLRKRKVRGRGRRRRI